MNLSGSLQINIGLESSDDLVKVLKFLSTKDSEMAEKPRLPLSKKERPEKAGYFKQTPLATVKRVLDELEAKFGLRSFTSRQASEVCLNKVSVGKTVMQTALACGIKQGIVRRERLGHYVFLDKPGKAGQVAESQDMDKVPKNHARALKSRTGSLSRRQRDSMRTLNNDLLFFCFKRKLEALNPDGIDETVIDRSLEPHEALMALKKKHPEIRIYPEDANPDFVEEFREYLGSIGVENERVQDLVIARMEADPFTEQELKAFADALKASQEPMSAVVPAS